MSWLRPNLNLSDSLSSITNITGQISSFTREMLTEGTEEVADPSAELNVAQNRIRELDTIINSQKNEYDKLKHLNDELHERVEASELQMRNMSQDYRKRLADKEQEIINLKAELHNNEQELSQKIADGRKRHDSSDSLEDHDEMKQLKNEIVRLQTECHHWKSMSSSQDSQEKLHREIDQYQNELAALQSTYSQKIANLNKKYKGEMQKWEEERQDYLRKIDDLQHELNILEEVDNLEGMSAEVSSSGSDLAALKEELDLTHTTITDLRCQLEKTVELAKRKTSEYDTLQEEYNRTTLEFKSTEEKLARHEEKERLLQEQERRGSDVNKLQEQLLERENTLASLSNEINLLREELHEVKAERSELVTARDGLSAEQQILQESLTEFKQDVIRLSTSTLELMEELEYSQGVQHEQSYEIDCLKKVCTVKGGAREEIINLKNVISALWERYMATLRLYHQVRHELHNSNQRLLAQLQARHTSAQSVREQVADARTKLNADASNRQERVHSEKDTLLAKSSELQSRIEEQEALVEDLQADNEQITQETKEMIADVGCQTANDSLDERSDLVTALRAEKAVLESTIVGLQNKVQDLNAQVREMRGEPIKAESSDYYYSEDTRSDLVGDTASIESSSQSEPAEGGSKRKQDATDAGSKADKDAIIAQLNEQVSEYRTTVDEFEYIKADYEEDKYALERVVMDMREQMKASRAHEEDKHALESEVTDLREQMKASRAHEEDKHALESEVTDLREQMKASRAYEEDKHALECEVMDLREQMKALREEVTKKEMEKEEIKESGWENIDNSEVLDSLKSENEDLIKEKVNLVKALRFLEQQLITADIVQEEDMCGFETETERVEALVLNIKDWVIRARTAEQSEIAQACDSMVSVSLDESSQMDEEYQQAKRTIEELEWDNSMLREQTNDLINQIEAKTTELGLIHDQLEEKCSEIGNVEVEKKNLVQMINERDEKLDELQDSFDAQLMDLTASRDNDVEKKNLVQMINERDEKLDELQDSFDAQLMDLTASRDNDVDMLRSEQEGILQLLDEKQRECETLRKTSNELMNSIHEKQQGCEEMSESNKILSHHVHESEVLLQDLRNEKENLLALLESKEQLVMSFSEEKNLLANEKHDLNSLVQDYQEKLHVKDQEVANLSHLHFEVEQLGRQSKDHEFSRHAMEERIASLSGENEKLSSTLEERDLHVESLRAELKEKSSEVEYLGIEMDRLNEVVGSNLATRRDLERQLTSLRKRSEELQDKVHEEESKFDSLKLDLREKGAENDLLRLEIAKISKTLREKEELLGRTVIGSHGDNVSSEQGEAQAQVARMMRLLQEKEQEIAAMKQKEASLIAVVNQTDQTSHEALEHYQHQIEHLTAETNRLMAEVNQKDEELFTMNDRLEVIQEQMNGKVQASSMLHSEHGRLLALNESQGNEIAKLREKIGSMVHRLEENEKHKHEGVHRLQGELHHQSNAFRQEQERLMTLLQEKDKQIVALADAAVPVVQANVTSSAPGRQIEEAVQQNQALVVEQGLNRHENEVQEQKILALEGELASLNHLLREKGETVERLRSEKSNLENPLQGLKAQLRENLGNSSALGEKDNMIRNLEDELRTLKETLDSRANEVKLLQVSHENSKDALLHELEDLRLEKEDALLNTRKEANELRNKLTKALNSLGDCNFAFTSEGFSDVENNFQSIVQRIINQRQTVLREKDNEINTLKSQISNLNVLQQSSSRGDDGLEEVLREKEYLNSELIRVQNEKEDILQEKESIVADLQGQIIGLTKLVSEKERASNNGAEKINREKERTEKELEKLRTDKDDIQNDLTQKQSEFSKLRSDSDRLTSLIAEEKSNAARLQGDVEQYKMLLQEKEARMSEMAKEKEQLAKMNEEMEQKVSLLQGELASASGGQRDTEAKMSRELDRLREHLIQVEESYTREALGAEEREKGLRLRLAQAEEQLLSSSHSMHDRNRQAHHQLESLQEQLHAISGQRDKAVMQAAAVQEQAQQYATSLDNLQMVLEQFQREKDAQMYAIHQQAQVKVNAAYMEVRKLQQRENELQVQLQNAAMVVQEISNLKQELAARNEAIAQYTAEVVKLEEELHICHTRIRDLNTNNDNKVDKPLLKNLLMGYFHTAEAKRPDVIHVIGGFLGFTLEEMKEIGSGSHPPHQGGWISSFLPFGGPPRSPVQKKPPLNPVDRSFSELFVNFLEHESESAQTPLQTRRGGTTANPLLSGLTPKASPLTTMRASDRQPLASSTPIRHPTVATSSMATGASSAAPSPIVTGYEKPTVTAVHPVAMPTGAMSPIVPSPSGIRGSVPVPVGPQPTLNAPGSINPRPQGAHPAVSNPLLVGPMSQLPAISTSSPSSALRNVLFQTNAR